MAGRLDVRGPIEPVVEGLSRLTLTPSWRARIGRALVIPNSLRAARDNVHHHYDLGNSFYQQWLDRELVYTCAYFERPEMSLDEAQRAKLDLVCRKLQLRPGDTVVEAGCGWGALALFMAEHYGVRVKAFNVSREQLAFARERAAREGLSDRVEFIDDDYRNVRGTFDVFVSIGMLEHVGLSHLHSFAEVLRRSLRRDGGRGLLHFIGRDAPCPLNPWIRRRIFPGAYTPTLAEVTTRVLAPAGMSVIDVENLRLHYARTLELWAARYEAAKRLGAADLRRRVRARLGAVPRGIAGRVRHRVDAAVPGDLHAPRVGAAILDAGRALPPAAKAAHDSLRRARRRRRSRRLDVRAHASARRLERRASPIAPRFRATRCARVGSPRASSRCSTSIRTSTAPRG